jgi:hypothetical protein
LRRPGAVRELRESPHSRVLRSEMTRELRRLLYAGPDSLSILGFLVVSGGGLSARDLSDLTGSSPGPARRRPHCRRSGTGSSRGYGNSKRHPVIGEGHSIGVIRVPIMTHWHTGRHE